MLNSSHDPFIIQRKIQTPCRHVDRKAKSHTKFAKQIKGNKICLKMPVFQN